MHVLIRNIESSLLVFDCVVDVPVFCCFSILMIHLIDFSVVLQVRVETFLELGTFQYS